MENIPNEILFEILSYLEIDDRKDKRTVNKLWNEMIPSLPLTLSEQKKEKIIKNMRRISIQVHFVRDIMYYAFEDENILEYTFSDLDQNVLFELSMDPNWMTIGNYLTNVKIESSRWIKINLDLDKIFESEDILIQTYIEYMSYLLSQIQEIKYISLSSSDLRLDIETINKSMVEDVMAVIHNDIFYLIEKDDIFRDVFVFDIFKGYLEIMNKWKMNILRIFPKYVINDREQFEKIYKELIM
jgi:hypothetical protein